MGENSLVAGTTSVGESVLVVGLLKEGNLVGAEERVRQYWERRRRKRKGE